MSGGPSNSSYGNKPNSYFESWLRRQGVVVPGVGSHGGADKSIAERGVYISFLESQLERACASAMEIGPLNERLNVADALSLAQSNAIATLSERLDAVARAVTGAQTYSERQGEEAGDAVAALHGDLKIVLSRVETLDTGVRQASIARVAMQDSLRSEIAAAATETTHGLSGLADRVEAVARIATSAFDARALRLEIAGIADRLDTASQAASAANTTAAQALNVSATAEASAIRAGAEAEAAAAAAGHASGEASDAAAAASDAALAATAADATARTALSCVMRSAVAAAARGAGADSASADAAGAAAAAAASGVGVGLGLGLGLGGGQWGVGGGPAAHWAGFLDGGAASVFSRSAAVARSAWAQSGHASTYSGIGIGSGDSPAAKYTRSAGEPGEFVKSIQGQVRGHPTSASAAAAIAARAAESATVAVLEETRSVIGDLASRLSNLEITAARGDASLADEIAALRCDADSAAASTRASQEALAFAIDDELRPQVVTAIEFVDELRKRADSAESRSDATDARYDSLSTRIDEAETAITTGAAATRSASQQLANAVFELTRVITDIVGSDGGPNVVLSRGIGDALASLAAPGTGRLNTTRTLSPPRMGGGGTLGLGLGSPGTASSDSSSNAHQHTPHAPLWTAPINAARAHMEGQVTALAERVTRDSSSAAGAVADATARVDRLETAHSLLERLGDLAGVWEELRGQKVVAATLSARVASIAEEAAEAAEGAATAAVAAAAARVGEMGGDAASAAAMLLSTTGTGNGNGNASFSPRTAMPFSPGALSAAIDEALSAKLDEALTRCRSAAGHAVEASTASGAAAAASAESAAAAARNVGAIAGAVRALEASVNSEGMSRRSAVDELRARIDVSEVSVRRAGAAALAAVDEVREAVIRRIDATDNDAEEARATTRALSVAVTLLETTAVAGGAGACAGEENAVMTSRANDSYYPTPRGKSPPPPPPAATAISYVASPTATAANSAARIASLEHRLSHITQSMEFMEGSFSRGGGQEASSSTTSSLRRSVAADADTALRARARGVKGGGRVVVTSRYPTEQDDAGSQTDEETAAENNIRDSRDSHSPKHRKIKTTTTGRLSNRVIAFAQVSGRDRRSPPLPVTSLLSSARGQAAPFVTNTSAIPNFSSARRNSAPPAVNDEQSSAVSRGPSPFAANMTANNSLLRVPPGTLPAFYQTRATEVGVTLARVAGGATSRGRGGGGGGNL